MLHKLIRRKPERQYSIVSGTNFAMLKTNIFLAILLLLWMVMADGRKNAHFHV